MQKGYKFYCLDLLQLVELQLFLLEFFTVFMDFGKAHDGFFSHSNFFDLSVFILRFFSSAPAELFSIVFQ